MLEECLFFMSLRKTDFVITDYVSRLTLEQSKYPGGYSKV